VNANVGSTSLMGPTPAAPRRARRAGPPVFVLMAFGIVGIALVAAVLGGALAPHDPLEQHLNDRALTPSRDYLMGTDDLGRDVLSRILAGARAGMVGPGVIAAGALLIGTLMGVVGGYLGGWVDAASMRFSDFTLAVPHVLIVLVVAGVIGGGYWLAVALLTIFQVPYVARLVRGEVLRERDLPYVEAARSLGVSRVTIMSRHLLPNVAPVAISMAFVGFAYALVGLSSLSFLGVGVPPGDADWGRMLVENRVLIESNPWAAVAPGAAIVLTAAGANVVGDWLFDRLSIGEER
jgi:peptide/nickel transport system permease protein